MEEKFVSVPEHGGGSLITYGSMNPGTLHTVCFGFSEHLGLYRLELQIVPNQDKLGSQASTTGSHLFRIAVIRF